MRSGHDEGPLSLRECVCSIAGRYALQLLKKDIKPRDIMTRAAFENAMVTVIATGGSTNAVLHLIAMAHSVGIPLSLDDFQRVSDRVPFISDLKPSGKCALHCSCSQRHAPLTLVTVAKPAFGRAYHPHHRSTLAACILEQRTTPSHCVGTTSANLVPQLISLHANSRYRRRL